MWCARCAETPVEDAASTEQLLVTAEGAETVCFFLWCLRNSCYEHSYLSSLYPLGLQLSAVVFESQ